jgi:uncharacterized protein
MIERRLIHQIKRDLEWSPVIGLVGSRQVGKTTLVKILQQGMVKPTIYLDLELPTDVFKLEDAQTYLKEHEDKCVIIDEIQIKPELFALLRALIDQHRVPARFILLGSASPHIIKLNTETLAGRIAYHELAPFSWSEVMDQVTMTEHWLRGGFPGSLLAPDRIISRKWLNDFTETYIHRDLNRLGFAIPQPLLRNLLSMTAHLHGSTLNMSQLAGALGISQPTVSHYLDILEGSFLIRRLQPWFNNMGKRLVKTPKVYFRDSGLLHHLHRIFDIDTLRGHPVIGASWESYVIEQIIREAPEFTEFYYYRTQNGAEIDLLCIMPAGQKVCIEIKSSITPSISKGFYASITDLETEYNYVITPGKETVTRADGVRVVGLEWFLAHVLMGFAAPISED